MIACRCGGGVVPFGIRTSPIKGLPDSAWKSSGGSPLLLDLRQSPLARAEAVPFCSSGGSPLLLEPRKSSGKLSKYSCMDGRITFCPVDSPVMACTHRDTTKIVSKKQRYDLILGLVGSTTCLCLYTVWTLEEALLPYAALAFPSNCTHFGAFVEECRG